MNLRYQHIISSILKHLLIGTLLLGVTNCRSNSQILPTETEPIPTGDDRPTGGIENLGATCYMNATLQVLLTCYGATIADLNDNASPLVEALKKVKHAITVEKRTATSEEARFVFKALGQQFGWTTNECEQCDASQLLHMFLDWMAKTPFSTKNTFIQHSPDNTQILVSSKPIVEDACMHYVALPSSGDTCSMQQLFDKSMLPEQIDGQYEKDDGTRIDNVYKHKLLNLHERGILPLQLNRFDSKGGNTKLADGSRKEEPLEIVKKQDRVTNPMSLKISSEQTIDNKEHYYTLIGFVLHNGSFSKASNGQFKSSGHYKAYVKQEDKWVCCNDSSVTPITATEAESRAQEAYVFFYQPNPSTGGGS